VNGEFTLPTGNYRIFHWTINRKDEKGAAWTLSGYNFPKTAGFEVTADKTAVLEIGEPVQAVLKATENTNRQVAFSLSFVGRQKESIEMLRDGQRPRGPKLMLANADGTLCYTNTFEFG
jgi:ribosomal protein S1